MRKKILYRVTAAIGIALCSFSLFFAAPQATITAQAAGGGEPTVSPQADIYTWVYAECGDALWKRQWNATAGMWVTDWIFVRYL